MPTTQLPPEDDGGTPALPFQFGLLIDSLTDGFIVARSDGRIVRMNPAAVRMFGFAPAGTGEDGWHGSFDCLALDGTPVAPAEGPLSLALGGETFADRRLIVVRPARGIRFVGSFSGAPVDAPESTRRLAAVVVRDVSTEHRKALRLRHKERQLRGLIDALSIFVGLATPAGKVIELNTPARFSESLDRQAVIGRHLTDLPWWSGDETARETVRRAVADAADGKAVRCDIAAGFDGRSVDLDFMLAPLFGTNGRIRYLVASAVDIGDRVRAETGLRDALERQELLLKEMNHRIRNSLQLIATLVRMRIPQVGDDRLRAILDETAARIHTVATLHGRLYQQTDVGTVMMRPMLETLTADLASRLADPHAVSVTLVAGDLRIATDQAIPLALIANELLANAGKQAGPPDGSGAITLRLEPAADGRWRLAVVGPGMTGSVGEGLASRLVPALVKQIGGEMTRRDAGSGCEISISFAPKAG